MAKGWKTIFTNKDTTPSTPTKVTKHFENTIRNTKSLSIDSLKAENDKAYEDKIAKEENLLWAFDNKLFKSKTSIKQAIKIKKEREAAAKKSAEAKTEVTEQAS
jgi:hypothetical protein